MDIVLAVGQSVTLRVAPRNSRGEALGARAATWRSSDPTRVTVGAATGVCTRLATGDVTVYAEVDGITGTATLVTTPGSGGSGSPGSGLDLVTVVPAELALTIAPPSQQADAITLFPAALHLTLDAPAPPAPGADAITLAPTALHLQLDPPALTADAVTLAPTALHLTV